MEPSSLGRLFFSLASDSLLLETAGCGVRLHALPDPQMKAEDMSVLATDTECAAEYLRSRTPRISTPCEQSRVRTETMREMFVRDVVPLAHCTDLWASQ